MKCQIVISFLGCLGSASILSHRRRPLCCHEPLASSRYRFNIKVKEVIRNTAEKGTEIIVISILDTVKIFREILEPEDDMTLVVIKIRTSHLL